MAGYTRYTRVYTRTVESLTYGCVGCVYSNHEKPDSAQTQSDSRNSFTQNESVTCLLGDIYYYFFGGGFGWLKGGTKFVFYFYIYVAIRFTFIGVANCSFVTWLVLRLT